MRALVQRVAWAEVEAVGEVVGRIGRGLLVYAAVAAGDTAEDAAWLAGKVAGLRIFEDDAGRLNLSAGEVGGEVLAVSNFTLLADARKGRRPAFAAAAAADAARPVHEAFLAALRAAGARVAAGRFGAAMQVRSAADGPVNVMIDSPARG